MKLIHSSTRYFSAPRAVEARSLSGRWSTRYCMIASPSLRNWPSGSCSDGTCPFGLMAYRSVPSGSTLRGMSTQTISSGMPSSRATMSTASEHPWDSWKNFIICRLALSGSLARRSASSAALTDGRAATRAT